jgi:probable rRNA maturation factor
MLEIDNQSDRCIDTDSLESIYNLILEKEKREKKELALLLVDNGKSKFFNKKFRGKDSETDVISFSSELAFLPTYGDMIIDLSVADRQRGENTLDYEVIVLFIHGLLHLLGYDHLAKKDQDVMSKKEKEYINLFKKEIL